MNESQDERIEEEVRALRRIVEDVPAASEASKKQWREALGEEISASERRRRERSWLPVGPPLVLMLVRSLSEGPMTLVMVVALVLVYAFGARLLFAEAMALAVAPSPGAGSHKAVTTA